jgi:sulfonate transport system permease protein
VTLALAPSRHAPAPARWRSALRHRSVAGALGVAAVVVAWTVVAAWRPHLFPTPLAVGRAVGDDWSLISTNARTTAHAAALGWLWGNGVAIVLALAVALLPGTERAVLRMSAIVSCLPALAIGPILQVVLQGENPKIALSALAVVFTTLVGALVGLRAASQASLDVVRVWGGGRISELRKARLRSALPHLFASMRIAGPAAVLGAILGEYLGGATGLGPAMIAAQQQLEIARTWALGFAATALAAVAYLVAAVLGRASSPWSTTQNADAVAVAPAATRRGWRMLLTPLSFVASLGAVVFGWWALIKVFHLDPLVAKTPGQVWAYLFTDPDASANRSELVQAMRTTLGSAAVGYVAGTIVALLLVGAFVRWRPLELTLMPAAVVLQSVPLSVFTPIFLIMFGRGIVSSAFICGAVTFFPTLVMTLHGVRSVPTSILDVFDAHGASPTTKLRKAQLPAALPALLAAARVAVPRAVVGALLVEWLASGKGIGYLMLRSTTMFEYTKLWAAVVVCTFTMVVLYTVVTAIESLVLRRLGSR